MPRYFSFLLTALAIISGGQFIHAFSVSSKPQTTLRPPTRSDDAACTKQYLLPHSSGIRTVSYSSSRRRTISLQESETSIDDKTVENAQQVRTASDAQPLTCWNPSLRKQIAAISLLGVMETLYLTIDKFQSSETSLVNSLCSATGSSCKSVLNGPYSSITVLDTDIPLSLLGVGAYTTVLGLAVFPLLFPNKEATNGDANNRIALLGMTTLMGTFSVYLVSLILGVLHTTCVFCFVSAGLSISLAGMSWVGGVLPSLDDVSVDDLSRETVATLRKNGVVAGASSFGAATLMALGLFLSVDDTNLSMDPSLAAGNSAINSGTLVASTQTINYEKNIPPPITTKSSTQALALATDLSSLNSKMYGAFWCSHCYDQKQSLGLQAMQSIPYVECDREGYNNQRDLCRERDVPGYPTWEIGGELFPGERSLDELREIVDDVLSKKKGV
jgi:uncharacterized membrane protein